MSDLQTLDGCKVDEAYAGEWREFKKRFPNDGLTAYQEKFLWAGWIARAAAAKIAEAIKEADHLDGLRTALPALIARVRELEARARQDIANEQHREAT